MTGGRIVLHQLAERLRVGRAAADEAVRPERKNIAWAGNGDSISLRCERPLLNGVVRFAQDDLVDLIEKPEISIGASARIS